MANEKEIKVLLYRLEDVTALGVSLPLVAFPQLRTHVEKMRKYATETKETGLLFPIKETDEFIKKHSGDFNERDERALTRGFQRMAKAHPDRLDDWRKWNNIVSTVCKK